MHLDHTKLASQLLQPVVAAGAAIMRHRRTGFAVESKADRSPVTAADREAEDIILDALERCEPGVPVIAEEAVSRGTCPSVGSSFFLVDPLDGTREFVAGGTDFTVNIALVIDRTPLFGIVYAPAHAQLFLTLAADKAGELRFSPDADPAILTRAEASPIGTRVSDPERLIAVTSRSHRTPEDDRFEADPRIASCRTVGSSLKFCLVARGDADIYPRLAPTMEWDIAAGHAVLAAAGGAVTTPEGERIRYGKAEAGFRNGYFVAWGAAEPIPART